MQKPSIGRIIHYVAHGTPVREDGTQAFPPACRAAIITEVTEHPDADGTVGLCVLNPTGLFFNRAVEHAEDKANGAAGHPGGSWHWPERVDEVVSFEHEGDCADVEHPQGFAPGDK